LFGKLGVVAWCRERILIERERPHGWRDCKKFCVKGQFVTAFPGIFSAVTQKFLQPLDGERAICPSSISSEEADFEEKTAHLKDRLERLLREAAEVEVELSRWHDQGRTSLLPK
jgi:hypothetical protein